MNNQHPKLQRLFSASEVAKVTRLTTRQIINWGQRSYLVPAEKSDEGPGHHHRFNLKNILQAKLISALSELGMPYPTLGSWESWAIMAEHDLFDRVYQQGIEDTDAGIDYLVYVSNHFVEAPADGPGDEPTLVTIPVPVSGDEQLHNLVQEKIVQGMANVSIINLRAIRETVRRGLDEL